MQSFEKILLNSLKGVFQVSKEIKLGWHESYSGEPELITNMDVKFVQKYYLHEHLNEKLETKITNYKRPKL